jgi:hypothetical protein
VITLAALARDLFLLANHASSDHATGAGWEALVAARFSTRGVRSEPLPGGTSVLGHMAMSGLFHQVDSVIAATDGLVIAEWKSYRGALPKNEILRFRAVSDDYFLGLGNAVPEKPLIRVFGGPGRYRFEVRSYAALHGILLIDPDRWPVPVLVNDTDLWRRVGLTPPTDLERRSLAQLVHPMQHILRRRPDGSYEIPRPPSRLQLDAMLSLHDHWSDRLWEAVDEAPGTFEYMIGGMLGPGAA